MEVIATNLMQQILMNTIEFVNAIEQNLDLDIDLEGGLDPESDQLLDNQENV